MTHVQTKTELKLLKKKKKVSWLFLQTGGEVVTYEAHVFAYQGLHEETQACCSACMSSLPKLIGRKSYGNQIRARARSQCESFPYRLRKRRQPR